MNHLWELQEENLAGVGVWGDMALAAATPSLGGMWLPGTAAEGIKRWR